MPEAARPSDPTAHGDPLAPGPGSDNVSVVGKRQWRANVDQHLCKTPPAHAAEICKLGSLTVRVNGNMAVRKGDLLTGAGAPNTVANGAPTVLIGDIRMGLWDPANAAEFCRDMCQIRRNWSRMTPAQRRQALADAINRQLAKSGVPAIGVNPFNPRNANNLGNFDFRTWNMNVNQSLLNNSSLSDADLAGLGNTVYHEGRHAEQWYAAAQHYGPAAGSPGQLSSGMAIPQNVANSAFASPPAPGSYGDVFGGTMFQSAYGADGAYRNNVLNSLERNPLSRTAHEQYRALPEERDAWRTGDTMGSCRC